MFYVQAELLQEGIFFLLHLFARDVLAMKTLESEKPKPTFIISTFKTDIIKVGLVFSISNVFIAKKSLANKWRRKKIPSCSNSALEEDHLCIHFCQLNYKLYCSTNQLEKNQKCCILISNIFWELKKVQELDKPATL